VKRLNKGTSISVQAAEPGTKTAEEKEKFYLLVAAATYEAHREWYAGELNYGKDEVVEVGKISLILGQSSNNQGGSASVQGRGVKAETKYDTSINLAQEQEGIGGAVLNRQPCHLLNLVGGVTFAYSVVLVFPDRPTRCQEQPIRQAIFPTTTTFNVSDDKTGAAWSVVYLIVSNASEYIEGTEKLSAPGEEFGLSAEDRIANIVQGQTATLLKNPTRLTGISKFDGLRRLSAQSGNVS
jgi:hypothetical protein